MNTQISEHTYNYVFVRTDLPLPQQLVQAGHAALEAGASFGRKSKDPASLIILQVKNKIKLQEALDKIQAEGIKIEAFYEPDWDYGLTAFATEPLTEDQRGIFRKYRLWSQK